MTQNKSTLDPSSAVNVGGLVGGTLAFTDIDSENSMSEKVGEKFVLKPPPSPFNYKRNRTSSLSQYKSQSENNSQSSNQQFDINENMYPQKSRSLENPSLHYYPDIVIINDNEIRRMDIPSNEDEPEPEMIEMATLSVPNDLHKEETDETEENEVSFTNLDASSKRRIFASKARSDCGIIYDDHHPKLIDPRRNFSSQEVYPISFSEYSSEEGLPLSFETEYGIMIPKRHLEMQRAVMSYDDLLLEKYFQEEELRRQKRRLAANVRSTGSLRDPKHYDPSLYSYRDEYFHRHRHRHRRHRSKNRNRYVIKINRRPSKLQSSDSDRRYGSHGSRSTSINSDPNVKRKPSMDKKSLDHSSRRSYRSKHSLENSIETNHKIYANSKNLKKHRPVNMSDSSSEKEKSVMRPVRKSRSNDLNLSSFSIKQTRDLKLMSEPDLLHRSQSKRKRRHSFHSPKVVKKLYPHPDELLDQQPASVEGMGDTIDSSCSILDEKTNKISEQHVVTNDNVVTVQSNTHPSFLSVTDTDTGFDSTSKSIYSSPRRESKEDIMSYIHKSELRVKDSAYQTNQSSIDRYTIDSNPIIDVNLERHVPNGKR